MLWADNSFKHWRKLPISNPKPDLLNINACTKFGQNPLTFTQVIAFYGLVSGRQLWQYLPISNPKPGPSCSKLTTSLVNDSLKFTSSDMLKFFAEKMWVAFAVQKLLTFFQQKNIRILYIESAKTVNEMTLNELVKLRTLWTTGPRPPQYHSETKYRWTDTRPSNTVSYWPQPSANGRKNMQVTKKKKKKIMPGGRNDQNRSGRDDQWKKNDNISHSVWYPNYLLYDPIFTLGDRKSCALHMASYKRKIGSIPETEQKNLFSFERSVESASNKNGDKTENEHVEKWQSDYVVRFFSEVTEFEKRWCEIIKVYTGSKPSVAFFLCSLFYHVYHFSLI